MDKDTAVRRTAQHDEPINYETAKRVGELRKRLNLTLHDCAEYLGVPVTTLIKWENGTRALHAPCLSARNTETAHQQAA